MENILKLSEDGKVLLEVLDKKVKEVDIPEGIVKIEDGAFEFCNYTLENIHISSSVTYIGIWTFIPYPSLTSINVAADNSYFTSVNGILFSKDFKRLIKFPAKSNIDKYKIPTNVTFIGESAFSSCYIQEIDIPDSVKIIEETAFAGCCSLKVIDLPNSIMFIHKDAFWDCKSLQSIDIAENVKFIGDGAFRGCSSLQEIYIPSTVKVIGSGVFDSCKSLQNIYVDSDNSQYISINGILFAKGEQHLIKYPEGRKNIEYKIPDNTIIIGYDSFQGCVFLRNINITNNVRCIKEYAFSFSSLESIDIPSSVIIIENMAFAFCKSLKTIRFHHKEIEKCEIADNIFEDIDFEQCTLYIPTGTRWAYRHHPAFSKFKNIIPERQA